MHGDVNLVQVVVDLQDGGANGVAVVVERSLDGRGPVVTLNRVERVDVALRLSLVRIGDRSGLAGLLVGAGGGQVAVDGVGAVSVLIIELDGVVNLLRFPAGEHRVVVLVVVTGASHTLVVDEHLVGGHVLLVVGAAGVLDGQGGQRRDAGAGGRGGLGLLNALDPAQEVVAGAGRSLGHFHGLVDLQTGAGADEAAVVVVVPVDEGLDLLVLLDVLSLELHGVGIGAVLVEILLGDDVAVFVRDLGVVGLHDEGVAGERELVGVLVGRAIPLLDDPVAEDLLVVGGSRSALRDGLSQVDVLVAVGRSVLALARGVIRHDDAVGADEAAAPLGVEVQLAHGVGVVGVDLVVAVELAERFNRGVVEREQVEVVSLGESGVGEPAGQIVVDALAADVADLLAVVDVEGGRLRLAVVLDGVGGVIVGVEVDLVDLLEPLGVDGDAAFGHGLVVERLRAGRILEPTREHVVVHALLQVGVSVIRVARNVGSVLDAINRTKRVGAVIVFNRAVFVVQAVHEQDGVLLGGVVVVDDVGRTIAGDRACASAVVARIRRRVLRAGVGALRTDGDGVHEVIGRTAIR